MPTNKEMFGEFLMLIPSAINEAKHYASSLMDVSLIKSDRDSLNVELGTLSNTLDRVQRDIANHYADEINGNKTKQETEIDTILSIIGTMEDNTLETEDDILDFKADVKIIKDKMNDIVFSYDASDEETYDAISSTDQDSADTSIDNLERDINRLSSDFEDNGRETLRISTISALQNAKEVLDFNRPYSHVSPPKVRRIWNLIDVLIEQIQVSDVEDDINGAIADLERKVDQFEQWYETCIIARSG